LRSVNIPVKRGIHAGHSIANFSTEGLYMSHGDDPYNGHTWMTPAVPMVDLLIDRPTYDQWFGADPTAKNVGRASVQFAVEHLSNLLVYARAVEGAQVP